MKIVASGGSPRPLQVAQVGGMGTGWGWAEDKWGQGQRGAPLVPAVPGTGLLWKSGARCLQHLEIAHIPLSARSILGFVHKAKQPLRSESRSLRGSPRYEESGAAPGGAPFSGFLSYLFIHSFSFCFFQPRSRWYSAASAQHALQGC